MNSIEALDVALHELHETSVRVRRSKTYALALPDEVERLDRLHNAIETLTDLREMLVDNERAAERRLADR